MPLMCTEEELGRQLTNVKLPETVSGNGPGSIVQSEGFFAQAADPGVLPIGSAEQEKKSRATAQAIIVMVFGDCRCIFARMTSTVGC